MPQARGGAREGGRIRATRRWDEGMRKMMAGQGERERGTDERPARASDDPEAF